jgi:nitrite reductase/ring-hydroxylating ferredoxin subunit
MIEVGTTAEIPLGERKVVDTSAGSIIVANVDGSYYAVNAKCPHLGFPMKKVQYYILNMINYY